jgi:hypothetical protein
MRASETLSFELGGGEGGSEEGAFRGTDPSLDDLIRSQKDLRDREAEDLGGVRQFTSPIAAA